MNEDRSITEKLRIVKPKDTPSKLADDLAAANAKLEQAKLEHHRARQVVVSKGVERAARLADLQKEIAAEQEQVSAVIESASKGS